MIYPDLMHIQGLASWFTERYRKDRPKSVLVVEDDVFMKPMVTQALYFADPTLSIRWTTSVAEAMQAIEEQEPDLLIADCLLGDGPSGMDLWDHCRKNHSSLPFLMVTGLREGSLKKFNAKSDESLPELLHKPFLFRDFKNRVKALLATTFG